MKPHKVIGLLGLALMSVASSGVTPDVAVSEKAATQKLKYNAAEHLLDGTSFEYFYQTGGGLKLSFNDGKL